MKRILTTLSLFFLPFMTFAQDSAADSLKSVIETIQNDSSKVLALNDLSFMFWDTKPDTAIHYAMEARDLGNKINYKEGVAYALKNIGLGYYTKANYIEVLEYWKQSLAVFDSIGDKVGVSNILNNLGSVYFDQGDEATAVDYYFRGLRAAEEVGDKLRIASAYLNIGNAYSIQAETYARSLEYFSQALALGEELNKPDITGTASVNMGELYFREEEYDSALFYFDKSLKAFRDGESSGIPYSLNNIGKLYSMKGEYSLAIDYHRNAYEISQKIKDKRQMAQSLIGIGDAYRLSKDYDRAIEPYLEAESLVRDIGALNELQEIYKGLSVSYSELSQYTKAFNYQTRLTEINYELYNAENDKKIERMQFSYDLEKKQDEIDILAKTAEIEQLKAKRQEAISYGIGVVGLLILVMAGLLFHRYKFVQRTKKIIETEKERSENLLLNILPEETAEELKIHGESKARKYEMVSILFTDFKGFTALSATLSPEELVKEIHHCYKAFDEIVTRYGVEKIKTIGDAYMAAGGLPVPNETHALDVLRVAVEIRDFMINLKEERQKKNQPFFEIRIGIHSGPVVAGIVGTKKFAYDIWGDTVNIASRMESNGVPGKINISETTFELIREQFTCTPRGAINVKGGGDKVMYFVEEEIRQVVEMG